MYEPLTSKMLPLSDGTQSALFGPWTLRSAYQPIFDLSSGKAVIAGFEALVRPFIAGRASTPAILFANTYGGENKQRLETLTRELHIANAEELPVRGAMLFINLDPSAIADRFEVGSAISAIRRAWARTGAEPERLVCEVTERKAKSPAILFALADAVRANGFQLAVDDFGAANSDADRLAKLRPDIVKFDGRWVTRLMRTKPGYAQLKDMTAQFAGLGIKTVFEGIEHLEQLELSETAGATFVQGYALARPEIAPTTFDRFVTWTPAEAARARLVRDAVAANRQRIMKPAFGLKIA